MDYEIIAKPKEAFAAVIIIAKKKGGIIDGQDARELAMFIFGLDKNTVHSAKMDTVDKFIRGVASIFCPEEVKINTYGFREGLNSYTVRFGYEPKRNIILYSEKVNCELLSKM